MFGHKIHRIPHLRQAGPGTTLKPMLMPTSPNNQG